MPVKSAKSTPSNRLDLWPVLWPALALVLVVFVAYIPALRGQFIWDDDAHVTRNATLHSLAGLGRIWFQPGATQQYYPLMYSTFWMDYHLWGLNPAPYHLENIFLHVLNAILVWRILRRLEVPGAWLGAALFALHPVCVESVAWISERKNTLSGFFFLLSLFATIEFWLPRPAVRARTDEKTERTIFGPWKFYALALCLYLCALWSKTAIAGLPGVILILVWWKRGRIHFKDVLLIVPFLALGLAIGLLTVSLEHKFVLDAANLDEWKLSLGQKCIIAGRALWFYLGKLCWPYPLTFVYPRWNVQASQPLAYLPLVAAMAGVGLLWLRRNAWKWARPTLVAAGYFVAMLFPALGFIDIFPFRYSFVADHFQYVALIGPLAWAAAGITLLPARVPASKPAVKVALMGALLAVFAVLTCRQTGVYRNLETLWRDTLAKNPAAWMAHDNLGIYLTESKHFAEADEQYRKALEIRPNDHIAYYDLGLEAAIQGNLDQAIQYFYKTLDLCPGFAMAHYQIANVFVRKNNLDDAIREYKTALESIPTLALGHFNLATVLLQQGKMDEAMEQYRRTLDAEPDYAPAHVALGRMLAAKGNSDGAISEYREALDGDPNSVEALASLGNAQVAKGQLDEAVASYREALRLDPNSVILHMNLSVALARQGNSQEAQQEQAEAKQLQAGQGLGQ